MKGFKQYLNQSEIKPMDVIYFWFPDAIKAVVETVCKYSMEHNTDGVMTMIDPDARALVDGYPAFVGFDGKPPFYFVILSYTNSIKKTKIMC